MTWRERIVAARERGSFTKEEKAQVLSFSTCLLGESAIAAFGVHWKYLPIATELWALGLNDIGGHTFGLRTDRTYHRPICDVEDDLFDNAERDLDFIEDRVLELKRGQMSEKDHCFSDNSGDHVEP